MRAPLGGSSAGHVDIEVHATATTVVVRGDLDLVSAPVLARLLAPVLAARPRRLVFDLAQTGFIDCAAARLLASTGRSLPSKPVIRSPNLLVRRVLELTGLDGQCEIETPARPSPEDCDAV